jgi:hypothetical protein
MSTRQVHKDANSQEVASPIKKWETGFILSALKTRYQLVNQAKNLGNKIREITEPERVQATKLRKRQQNIKVKAVKENTPYNEFVKAISAVDAKIKTIRDSANEKTKFERVEKTTVTKQARELDMHIGGQVMSRPEVQPLNESEIADVLEVE